MSKAKINSLLALSIIAFIALACTGLNRNRNTTSINAIAAKNTNTAKPTTNNTAGTDEGESTSGTEKQKPIAGKGNVQGKVLFNSQPVAGINVTLCEKFRTLGGIDCSGKTFKAKTGADGVFVIANADPLEYQGLMAQIFTTNGYIYPRQGILEAQKFTINADRTTYARDINLFKQDLKTTAPKAAAKVDANGLQMAWNAYPDADYYKVYVYSEDAKIPSPYTGEKVEDTTFTADKPLTNGKYRLKVEAYNGSDRKISESDGSTKFTVTGGAEPPAAN